MGWDGMGVGSELVLGREILKVEGGGTVMKVGGICMESWMEEGNGKCEDMI